MAPTASPELSWRCVPIAREALDELAGVNILGPNFAITRRRVVFNSFARRRVRGYTQILASLKGGDVAVKRIVGRLAVVWVCTTASTIAFAIDQTERVVGLVPIAIKTLQFPACADLVRPHLAIATFVVLDARATVRQDAPLLASSE